MRPVLNLTSSPLPVLQDFGGWGLAFAGAGRGKERCEGIPSLRHLDEENMYNAFEIGSFDLSRTYSYKEF